MHPFIEAVKEKRGKKPYRVFAEELGISMPHLFPVLQGKRNPGVSVLAAVAVNFPELDELLLDYLRSKHEQPD